MTTTSYAVLQNIFVDRFGVAPEKLALHADIQKDLNLDSMDAVDLLLAVNDRFHVRIPEDILTNTHTIADLIAAIEACKPTFVG